MTDSATEVKHGERFAFGKNWSHFLKVMDEDRIKEAEASLQTMLGRDRLDGLTFLDIGSGSGLFSLAAWRLGAKVHSFDYDTQSVATTLEMRRRYCNNESSWTIETGSVLDIDYLKSIGEFDIVYSWGVLHHTGSMWHAMKNIISSVKPEGLLFIALYNDQGFVSQFWSKVKYLYCSGSIGRSVITISFFPIFALAGLVSDILNQKNPTRRYSEYRKKRGMSLSHDWIDWLGGYPYETAKPEEVFEFYTADGFTMTKLTTCQTLGCNQFVFQKTTHQSLD